MPDALVEIKWWGPSHGPYETKPKKGHLVHHVTVPVEDRLQTSKDSWITKQCAHEQCDDHIGPCGRIVLIYPHL